MRLGWTIFRYLIGTVLPYFVSAWLLLSVVLFVQQASRFSDIFFSANIPSGLIWQLSLALIPNVIAFTCPMAALVGVIIGLTKMQSDSELVAIRASGVGNLGITLPLIVLGIVLSLFAFLVNLKGVPFAAGVVRQVALRTALYKLESPIEPGVFNTELAGFTIYVKDGDIETGSWKNIFIYNEDEKTKTTRLITSESGRIDYSNEVSELVLENAVGTTLTGPAGAEKLETERIGEVRYSIRTKRSEIVERLNNSELSPEELGLSELSTFAQSKEGSDRIEALLLWQRRIMLSVTPLVFCIFGAAFVLRYNRASRGFAIFAALLTLISYYLLAFFGEQMARTGKLNVYLAGLFPLAFSIAGITWLNLGSRLHIAEKLGDRVGAISASLAWPRRRGSSTSFFRDVTAGIRDLDLLLNLAKYYVLALAFLGAVFLIFTAFELWKYAGTFENGIPLLFTYLFYLTPFIYLQLSPSSLMIATLATYVIKSRQNEVVTWTASGLSVYRLLVPCLLFMAFFGLVNWIVQEKILPHSNAVQDELRDRIRNRGVSKSPKKLWVAERNRILSFDKPQYASDNAHDGDACKSGCEVVSVSIYDFGDNKAGLQALYRATGAKWEKGKIVLSDNAVSVKSVEGRLVRSAASSMELEAPENPFGPVWKKPSHLSSEEIRQRVSASGSEVERRNFQVVLERRYTTPFLPFTIALFTAPFALSLSRKGKAATISFAVGLWLFFMALTSVFDQLGAGGLLPPAIAVWAPLMIFSMAGIVMLSRVRT